MTDQPTTIIPTDSADTIVAEANNAMTIVYGNLHLLTTETDAHRRVEIAQHTWQWVEYTTSLITQARDVVGAASETVAIVIQQRDKALDELSTLVTAIETLDYNHPKIEVLAEVMEQEIYEYVSETMAEENWIEISEAKSEAFEEGEGSYRERLIDDIASNLMIGGIDAESLIDSLAGRYTLSHQQIETLIDHLNRQR